MFIVTAIGAIASCVGAHFALGIFGLDILIHSWSSQLGASIGFIDPATLANAHAGHGSHFGHAFNNVSSPPPPLSDASGSFVKTVPEAQGLPVLGY